MSLQTRLQDLITALGTDYKNVKTWLFGSTTGGLTDLTTTTKTSVVAAVNEVNSKIPLTATTSRSGTIQIATSAEVTSGTGTTKAVTPATLRQEIVAVKSSILGTDVPAALDTLSELADALGDNADFAATTVTALGNRVRVDTNAQGLTTEQMQNARTNIGAYGSPEIGNPDADLVALYTTAKA